MGSVNVPQHTVNWLEYADGTVRLATASCSLWHHYPLVKVETELFPVASHKLSHKHIRTTICDRIEGRTS
jgi:hypothetical protein